MIYSLILLQCANDCYYVPLKKILVTWKKKIAFRSCAQLSVDNTAMQCFGFCKCKSHTDSTWWRPMKNDRGNIFISTKNISSIVAQLHFSNRIYTFNKDRSLKGSGATNEKITGYLGDSWLHLLPSWVICQFSKHTHTHKRIHHFVSIARQGYVFFFPYIFAFMFLEFDLLNSWNKFL